MCQDLRVRPHAFQRPLAFVEIVGHVFGHTGLVGKVVEGATIVAKEAVVPTLERSVVRQGPQVPFADERGGIAHGLEQGRQRGVLRRQAEVMPCAEQRFFQAARQAVLVAPRDQCNTCGRAHGRLGRQGDPSAGSRTGSGRRR